MPPFQFKSLKSCSAMIDGVGVKVAVLVGVGVKVAVLVDVGVDNCQWPNAAIV